MFGKKITKRMGKIIAVSVVCLIVIGVVVMAAIQSSKPQMVNAITCEAEQMEQVIDLSGTVISLEKKTFFADAGAVVKELPVSTGDYVKSGDTILKYDLENLENQLQINELKLQSAEAGYDDSVQSNGKVLYRLGEARTNLKVVNQQVEDFEAYVKELKDKISKKQSELSRYGTLLQITLLDLEENPDPEAYLNIQKLIKENLYEQENNAEIKAWRKELEEAEFHLSECRSYQSQMRAQENSSIDGAMTKGGTEHLEADLATTKIQSELTRGDYEKAKEGICAQFNGIVTSVDVVEGAMVEKGMQLMTMESMDDVAVEVFLTKYDLERIRVGQSVDIVINGQNYTGEVKKINSVAEKNANNATVVGAQIGIEHPDDTIILGIEAKAKVLVGEESQAITVPNETINYDANGAFVMVVKDGILEKRSITIGLTNDMKSQVVSGLEVGDVVVTDSVDYLEEGTAVNAVVEQ